MNLPCNRTARAIHAPDAAVREEGHERRFVKDALAFLLARRSAASG